MSADSRKVINPLLNVSVTGGTLEEFTQNAVLLPAAVAPPVQQTPQPPTILPPAETNLNDSYSTCANEQTTSYFDPTQQANNYQQPTGQAFFGEYPIHQGSQVQAQPQPQYSEQPQAGLQSVLSSFSSYLKIGSQSKQQEADSQAVPSVVDSVLSSGDPPNTSAQPVRFYAPSGNNLIPSVPAPGSSTATTSISTNTYRRGGLKRPSYAPIPGLTTGAPTQVLTPPQIPSNLPQLPPLSHSPLTPFVGNPLQCTVSSDIPNAANHYPVSNSPAVTSSHIAPTSSPSLPSAPLQVQQIERIKETLQTPFLSPLPITEELQLPSVPIQALNTSTSPTILTPSTYYPVAPPSQGQAHSFLLNPEMSTSDSPRASPALRIGMEATDRPILTHNEATFLYRPVYHHWFFKKVSTDTKSIWSPFSMTDSLNLETAYLSPDLSPDRLVPTDGGRYDVNILLRERSPVYWTAGKSEVRRCSWFHKGSTDGRYAPYEENIATKLEEEFKIAFESSTWNRKVELPNGETVVFHGPDVLVLFPQTQCPDSWGNSPNQARPRVVKRGLDEFHIDEGEPAKVDHLLFLVHGIGSVCDLKFRAVEEVVDEFRNIALQLVQSHYRSSCESEVSNRIEVLPISWHGKLHSEETGVDQKLKGITLESIPKLRDFTNDTILDVLFYTSPIYCQTIISTVGNELNRIYGLFKQRNPSFSGGVSLGGHSLGSLILFDLLCHQHAENDKPPEQQSQNCEDDDISSLKPPPNARKMSRRISYMMGKIGTGQPQLTYPNLTFNPRHFFALGSPVGMFVTVRGLDTLGEQFALPTCPAYYNIFHPYDPVAYRVESLINPELAGLKPVLIPHHKGRKRMHLELKETMARVGADLKQKLIDSMKSTWNSFYQFTLFKGQTQPSLEDEVNKVLQEQLNNNADSANASDDENNIETEPTDLSLGILNQGRRIDYVLQEAPLEFFNEYIFALTSHVCYWESEDTILLIVKEIYNAMNISADSQIPQQSMKIERTYSVSSTPSDQEANGQYGVNPTVPMSNSVQVGPPPLAGFVRKS